MRKIAAVLSLGLAVAGGWWLFARAPGEGGDGRISIAGVVLREPRGAAGGERRKASAQRRREVAGDFEVRVLAAGRPRAGAEVRLYQRGEADPFRQRADWTLLGSERTGSDGLARFHLLGAGSYFAAARAPGMAAARREVARPLGQKVTRVELALEAGGALTGRTVAHGGEEPVPLARVSLIPVTRGVGRHARADAPADERPTSTSDALGRFAIEGLAPGLYRVEAEAAGFVRSFGRRVSVPRAEDLLVELSLASFIEGHVLGPDARPARGALVTAQGGRGEPVEALSDAGGSFSLEVAPGSWRLTARRGSEAGVVEAVAAAAGVTARGVVLHLGAASAIEGSVTALSTGAPVEGAWVSARPLGASGDFGRAQADAGGRFTLDGLAPGTYVVEAAAENYSPSSRKGIAVVAGQRFPLRFSLQGVGQVVGSLRDGAGRPVAGAVVTALRPGGGGGPEVEVRSDAAGEFRIGGLPVGKAYLSAMRGGALLGLRRLLDVRAGEEARADFTLPAAGSLTGRVAAGGGREPSPGALVRIASDGESATGATEVAADQAGLYRAELPAGRYRACAMGPEARGGCHGAWATVIVEEERAARLDLELKEEARDEEPDTPRLRGLVLEPTGTPSPGAVVSAWELDDVFAVADGEGRFALHFTGAQPSEVRVRAWNGARAVETSLAPGAAEQTIRLLPGASLRGQVVARGAAADNFLLRAGPADAQALWPSGITRTYEFAGDRYELPELPATKVKIRVRASDGRTGEAVADLAAGASAELNIDLQATCTASGRVVDSAGRPVALVSVHVEDHAPMQGDDALTHADGRFQLAGLLPGERGLRLRDQRGRSLVRSFTIAPAQRLDLGDLMLESPKIPPGSIGAVFAGRDGNVSVQRVIIDSPAMRAGLAEGDVVLALDGVAVKNSTDARQRAMGAPGTPVVLTVRRGLAQLAVGIVRANQ